MHVLLHFDQTLETGGGSQSWTQGELGGATTRTELLEDTEQTGTEQSACSSEEVSRATRQQL